MSSTELVAAICFAGSRADAAPPASPDETVAARNLPSVDSYFGDAAKATAPEASTPSESTVREALARGAMDILRAESDPGASIESQPVLARLQTALAHLGDGDGPPPDVVGIHVGEHDRWSEDVVVFTFNRYATPVIAVHRIGTTYRVLPFGGDGEHRNTLRAVDVTGDGVKDVVAGYGLGGSGGGVHVEVSRWVAKGRAFTTIFQADLDGWVGPPCEYRLLPTAGRNDVEVSLPVVGVFEGRFSEHRVKKEVWTYDRQKDRFVLRRRTILPPTTSAQQLGEAEDLFRRGDVAAAAVAYHRMWSERLLPDEAGSASADHRRFARLREGQMLALLGREDEARKALDDAIASGGDVGRLAAAFRDGYAGPDGAARAWAALPSEADLFHAPSDAPPTNLPPADDVLYPGAAVTAYLTSHPDAAKTPDTVFATLRGWGLETSVATAADLDGDGTNEFLFQTPKDSGRRLWVIRRTQRRWLADDSICKRIAAFGVTVPLRRGHAIELIPAPTAAPVVGGVNAGLTMIDGRLRWVDMRSLEVAGAMGRADEWPSCTAEYFARLQ